MDSRPNRFAVNGDGFLKLCERAKQKEFVIVSVVCECSHGRYVVSVTYPAPPAPKPPQQELGF